MAVVSGRACRRADKHADRARVVKVLPRNQILSGDAATVLAGLLPESVDTAVTSPPYYNLRDYGVPGQMGTEPTVSEFVDNLLAVTRRIHRVLKPTGSLW